MYIVALQKQFSAMVWLVLTSAVVTSRVAAQGILCFCGSTDFVMPVCLSPDNLSLEFAFL